MWIWFATIIYEINFYFICDKFLDFNWQLLFHNKLFFSEFWDSIIDPMDIMVTFLQLLWANRPMKIHSDILDPFYDILIMDLWILLPFQKYSIIPTAENLELPNI